MIQEQIEELIEESYLLSLTEPEIKNYLRNFLKACETVMSENLSIHGDYRIIGVKLVLLKVQLLWRGKVVQVSKSGSIENPGKSAVEFLAEQVIRNKGIILKLLKDINPQIAEAVIEENKKLNNPQGKCKETVKLQKLLFKINKYAIYTGYYILLIITIYILSVYLIQML